MLHGERQAFQGRPRPGGSQVDQIAGHLLVRSGLGRFGPPVAVVFLDRTDPESGKGEEKQEKSGAGGRFASHVSGGVTPLGVPDYQVTDCPDPAGISTGQGRYDGLDG